MRTAEKIGNITALVGMGMYWPGRFIEGSKIVDHMASVSVLPLLCAVIGHSIAYNSYKTEDRQWYYLPFIGLMAISVVGIACYTLPVSYNHLLGSGVK